MDALKGYGVNFGGVYDETEGGSLQVDSKDIFKLIYPIGSIYISVKNVNPQNMFGGTWTSWGAGRVPVGVDINDSDFNVVEKTGGEKKHTMTIAELVRHAHNIGAKNNNATGLYEVKATNNTGETGDAITKYQGGGQPFNIQQQYITCYMWKRVA